MCLGARTSLTGGALCVSQRAVFFANRAACHAKLADHTSVVADCTAALKLKPDYAKALLRRSIAHEALDKASDALQDAKKALELDPNLKEAASSLPRLEKKAAAQLEKQKEEMMGQLKDLGNKALGARHLAREPRATLPARAARALTCARAGRRVTPSSRHA